MAKMHARRRGKSASAKPLVTENPEIKELDINPLIVYPRGSGDVL